MLTIYLHELADQMRSLRFQVSLVVLLLFFVSSGVIYALKMARDVEETKRIEQDIESRIEEEGTIGDAATRWYRALAAPVGTEFIAEGGYNWFTDVRWMNPRSGYGMVDGNRVRTTNHWIRRFEVVDWSVIVRLVVSFICVVMAYDAISRHFENGTLRLTMANPVSRGTLLIGRMAAQWTTVMVSVAIGAAVALLILLLQGVLTLDQRIAGAAASFFATTGIYVALFLLLATGVSAVARSSAASLVVLILAWAVLTVVVPQTAYLVGSRVVSIEFVGDIFDENFQLLNETENALQRDGIVLRDRQDAGRDGFAMERKYLQRLEEVEQQQRQKIRDADALRERQFRAARTINLLSPGYAFQYGLEGLLGTGLARRQHFIEQAWRHRETLRQHLRGLDASDPDSPHLPFLAGYMSDKPFDASTLPRFVHEPMPISRGLDEGLVPIVVLCLETALAFFFAFWAFLRMDLTGNE